VNEYGPTETVVGCCIYELEAGAEHVGEIPIGQPINNTRVYVLDRYLHPVPFGVTGELYIGGIVLARGYLRQPELTAERFVADPFGKSGNRIYRTGDLARWRTDGQLEFLGRADQQLKIRGFRIEPGEIEAALRASQEVAQAVVIGRESQAEGKQLVAYVVGVSGQKINSEALRERLTQRLPDYMVPSIIIELEVLPLTPSGKLDRNALPEPEVIPKAIWKAPRSSREETLCSLIGEVLGVERVGIDDNFFKLGGDSITSIQLVSRARRAGLIITPRAVFQNQTVESLAAVAEAVEGSSFESDCGVGALDPTPIMCWIFERGGPINSFSQSMLFHVPADLRENHLIVVLQALLDCHDALRLRMENSSRNGVSRLEIAAVESITAESCCRRINVSGLDEKERRRSLVEEAASAGDRLNPEDGVMLQAVWFDDGGNGEGLLLLVIHHLAVDGVSWRILANDLKIAWEAVAAGGRPVLGPRSSSFRRWAAELRTNARSAERIKELPLWVDM
ncbi:MAG: AMP-binding protein, partial [Ktedonobacteraceae bacterium]|nr:AMP-binding protein [Ktedonobacteraceae bacterium]